VIAVFRKFVALDALLTGASDSFGILVLTPLLRIASPTVSLTVVFWFGPCS